MPIKIYSSNSDQRADYAYLINEAGEILDRNVLDMPDITKFNTAEYVAYYGKLDTDIDILEIGYHYTEDGENKYEEPAWDFRKQVLVTEAVESLKFRYPELNVFDNETKVLGGIADVRLGTVVLDRAEYLRLAEWVVQDLLYEGRVLTPPDEE